MSEEKARIQEIKEAEVTQIGISAFQSAPQNQILVDNVPELCSENMNAFFMQPIEAFIRTLTEAIGTSIPLPPLRDLIRQYIRSNNIIWGWYTATTSNKRECLMLYRSEDLIDAGWLHIRVFPTALEPQRTFLGSSDTTSWFIVTSLDTFAVFRVSIQNPCNWQMQTLWEKLPQDVGCHLLRGNANVCIQLENETQFWWYGHSALYRIDIPNIPSIPSKPMTTLRIPCRFADKMIQPKFIARKQSSSDIWMHDAKDLYTCHERKEQHSFEIKHVTLLPRDMKHASMLEVPSSDEIWFIGGVEMANLHDASVSASASVSDRRPHESKRVDVYNWQTDCWSRGPDLVEGRLFYGSACSPSALRAVLFNGQPVVSGGMTRYSKTPIHMARLISIEIYVRYPSPHWQRFGSSIPFDNTLCMSSMSWT